MGNENDIIDLLRQIDHIPREKVNELLALANLQAMMDPSFKSKLSALQRDPNISQSAKMIIKSAC